MAKPSAIRLLRVDYMEGTSLKGIWNKPESVQRVYCGNPGPFQAVKSSVAGLRAGLHIWYFIRIRGVNEYGPMGRMGVLWAVDSHLSPSQWAPATSLLLTRFACDLLSRMETDLGTEIGNLHF